MTVTHLYDPSAHCCGFRIVRDHDDGLIEAVVKLLKHVENQRRILGIKVTSRLIGEHDRRTSHNCAGECDPLLLTTRKFEGFVM